ncbi:MAG: OmpA family protein [Alphaproteobacteria bacterium]|nr:OmpA family protein [Alphaproteobacteria bacterium]MBR3663013.1 OmpA family protein [Alphaproteobacteria bacterium]
MKKLILCFVALGMLNACATDAYTGESKVAKTAWGTGIGAAVGAGVGALIGGEKGALIGAGIGGAAGAATGGYMDVQESKLRQKLTGTGVQVARDGDNIRLIMPNSITFKTNDSAMKTSANAVLDSVAQVANEYDKTRLQIVGYTDSTGNDKINIPLSERRAASVANYLTLRGVNGARMNTYGAGAANPIASNATEEGKAQNRRVEITLINAQ